MSILPKNKRQISFITTMLVIFIVLFLYLIRQYIVVLILGLIFAALLTPIFNKLTPILKGKKSISAILVTLLFLLTVVIPGFLLLEEIVRQALDVAQTAIPYIEKQLQNESQTQALPEWVPFRDILVPYTTEIFSKINSALGSLVNSLVQGLSTLTQNTAVFLLKFFIMLYAVYSFMRNNESISASARKYLPITSHQFDTLVKEIVNVSKATLKGAVIIGVIQGLLVGMSFWVAGIGSPLFWAAVTAFASLIPGVGTALVYVPGGLYLIGIGETTAGIGVLTWGMLVVGSIDNILRPMLVGQDMQMSDIMVLVSTLGGIAAFGISGVILGPLIVGLLQVFIKFNHQENPF